MFRLSVSLLAAMSASVGVVSAQSFPEFGPNVSQPQLQAIGDEGLLLVWKQRGPDGSDLFISYSDGGSFSAPMRINDVAGSVNRSPIDEMRPSVAIGPGDKVAVAGFCWGGAQAFRLATLENTLVAAFVFYGRPPESDAMAKIACPVYGFYGETDARINSTLDETKASMVAAGKTFETVIYPGVGHAFLPRGDRDDASEEQKAATRGAWARVIARHLPLLGLSPGGVYPASPVTRTAVRSYRTLSPLPPARGGRRFAFCGTFPGLAAGCRYQPP